MMLILIVLAVLVALLLGFMYYGKERKEQE